MWRVHSHGSIYFLALVCSRRVLSDLMPLIPLARMIAMLQMFCGVMYLALVVSRLIALQYIQHRPNDHPKEN